MNAMDCGEVERQIGRLPYGELSRVEIETLMDHAAACAACRERLMAVRSLEAIIGRNLKRLGGDPTFARRVMERLEREEARRARGTGERTPAPGAETGGTEGGAGVRGWSAADAALVRDRRVLIAVLVAAAVPVVMLALFLPSRGHQEKPRGDAAIRILAATGTVHVLQKTGNGLSAFLPAMAGMSLRPGDRLAGTGAGGGAVRLARAAAGTPDRTAFSVRFRDGAEVAALPDGNIRLAKGEILISVGRLPEGSPPFSVECAGGRAE
ncbi:MAG: hypothetical protein N3A38_16390, partial [Planctomycetota bacterium]|nr:hypothetical protein [Planctomycetota bacterium]